jgi:hypothetical protein
MYEKTDLISRGLGYYDPTRAGQYDAAHVPRMEADMDTFHGFTAAAQKKA